MITYTLPDGLGELVLHWQVIHHLARHRQRTGRAPEAGGQLFCRFAGQRIHVVRATGPRRADRRGRHHFVPDRVAERKEIQRLYQRGLHYLGDWHTHPQVIAKPSTVDIRSMREMFASSRHDLRALVLMIVGTGPLPRALYVGCVNAEGCRACQLRQRPR